MRRLVESLMPRTLILACTMLALGGCATGYRGIMPQHAAIVSADGAAVPGCPDWSDSEINAGETMAANFGCATSANLAAMIADPQDLVHGKSSPTDPVEIARALKLWREQPPTGAKELEKNSPKGGGGQ